MSTYALITWFFIILALNVLVVVYLAVRAWERSKRWFPFECRSVKIYPKKGDDS